VVEVPVSSSGAFERAFGDEGAVRLGSVIEGAGILRWKGRPVGEIPLPSLYEKWRVGLGIP
jgi:hypothetical protein